MKKSTKILIAVACLIAVFLFIAYQPVTITKVEALGQRTYVIYREVPAIWEFYPQLEDTLRFQVSGNHSIHIYVFNSAKELGKYLKGEACSFVQSWDVVQIDSPLFIYWSDKGYFVCESGEPATVSITLTLERKITKRFYETWFAS